MNLIKLHHILLLRYIQMFTRCLATLFSDSEVC